MNSIILLFIVVIVNYTAIKGEGKDDSTCVYPGTCVPPSNYKYSQGRDVVPRKQWTISGGFCGALSIQSIALSYGAWISQDLIRKAAPDGGGHGNKVEGYEILHTNIETTLSNLKLSYVSWDFTSPQPQGFQYLRWLKSQLISNYAVVQFVLCKGDSHNSYGIGTYDHIEPIFRIYTNHSINDTIPYNEDVLAHGSDYSPDGDSNLGYFRRFDSLLDSLAMDGNCKDAGPNYGENEMYPCIYDKITYGYSITGFIDQQQQQHDQQFVISGNFTTSKPENLVIFVNTTNEPDIRRGNDPVPLQASINVNDLKPQQSYSIFRYDSVEMFPISGDYFNEPYSFLYTFTADESGSYKWLDPNTFLSSSSVYYRCVINTLSEKYS